MIPRCLPRVIYDVAIVSMPSVFSVATNVRPSMSRFVVKNSWPSRVFPHPGVPEI